MSEEANSVIGQAQGLIRFLYHGFVLRDVFGKAIPGAALLLAVLWWRGFHMKGIYVESFNWSAWHWGGLFGLTWLLGLTASAPALFLENWIVKKRYGSFDEFYISGDRFGLAAKDHQVTRRLRFTLLFEASIHCATAAMVLATVALSPTRGGWPWAVAIFSLAVVWCFFAVENANRAHVYQDAIIEAAKQRPQSLPVLSSDSLKDKA